MYEIQTVCSIIFHVGKNIAKFIETAASQDVQKPTLLMTLRLVRTQHHTCAKDRLFTNVVYQLDLQRICSPSTSKNSFLVFFT